MTYTDDQLLRGFEDATLPAAAFDHVAHVRAAFLMVDAAPLPAAAARFIAALRGFAAANGVPDRYHETITWAYLLIIHERRARGGGQAGWEGFAAANPDLLERGFLRRYYRDETLDSAVARRAFVMPDRAPPP